jgi:chorismate mutase
MLKKILHCFPDNEILKANGFDKAIIGIDEQSMRLIYSISKCISILMKRDKMSKEDALEFFEFNVKSAYVGEKTPIWCSDEQ